MGSHRPEILGTCFLIFIICTWRFISTSFTRRKTCKIEVVLMSRHHTLMATLSAFLNTAHSIGEIDGLFPLTLGRRYPAQKTRKQKASCKLITRISLVNRTSNERADLLAFILKSVSTLHSNYKSKFYFNFNFSHKPQQT
jgi:hypothetical protein